MSEPVLLTEREAIRGVAARWRDSYCKNGEWTKLGCGDFEEVYGRLVALDLETCSGADVEAVIGNESWTAVTCDGCKTNVTEAVQVGAEPDYESSTAVLCRKCCAAALALFPETP